MRAVLAMLIVAAALFVGACNSTSSSEAPDDRAGPDDRVQPRDPGGVRVAGGQPERILIGHQSRHRDVPFEGRLVFVLGQGVAARARHVCNAAHRGR